MRSYDQYCALARALDVIGERWALLIVRELSEGPRRYNELLDGLPGIATNLLAQRLRKLEADGVIERSDDGAYALTEWGQGLREPMYALGRWAGPLMSRPMGDASFRPHWVRHMVVSRFEGEDPQRENMVVEMRFGGEPVTLVSSGGRVQMVAGAVASPDLILSGPPDLIVGLVAGRLPAEFALAKGVEVTGDVSRLAGLRQRTLPNGGVKVA